MIVLNPNRVSPVSIQLVSQRVGRPRSGLKFEIDFKVSIQLVSQRVGRPGGVRRYCLRRWRFQGFHSVSFPTSGKTSVSVVRSASRSVSIQLVSQRVGRQLLLGNSKIDRKVSIQLVSQRVGRPERQLLSSGWLPQPVSIQLVSQRVGRPRVKGYSG